MLRRHGIVCLLALTWIAAQGHVLADSEEESGESGPRLHLVNGDLLSGAVADSDKAGILRWQSTFAVDPFDYPTEQINVAHFPQPQDQEQATEAFTIYTVAGEVLHGSLTSLDDEALHVQSKQFGALQMPISQLRHVARSGAGNRLRYVGPDGLVGWNSNEGKQKWREEVGHLLSAGSLAQISRQLPMPERASIEIAISWHSAAEFSAEFGKLFSLEVWKDKLVLVRETEEAADIQLISQLDAGAGQVHLQVFLDQKAGLVSVHTLAGEKLAAISLDGKVETEAPTSLTNYSGDFRLEYLAVREWDGRLPTAVDVTGPFVERVDHTVVRGNSIALDEDEIVVTGGDGEERMKLDEVFSIHFAGRAENTEPDLRVSLHDSTRLVGKLEKVEGRALHFSSPSITAQIPIPLDQLRSLVSLRKQKQTHDFGSQLGRLEAPGVRSQGKLVDHTSDDTQGCLVWQPVGSLTASALKPSLAARIVYVDRPQPNVQRVPAEPQQPAQQVQVDGFGLLGGVFRALNIAPGAEVQARRVRRPRAVARATHGDVLVLRAGDRLPCKVLEIGATNVRFESEFAEATHLPLDRLKAWERTPESSLDALDETKRRRLLTLPRMQRNNPPTHLIETTSGDFVRGRLASVDEHHLFVELRLDTKKIPREQIRRVVWLDDSQQEKSETEDDSPETEPVTRATTLNTDHLVQAVHRNGVRLSFEPKQVSDGVMSGTSEVLGACSVKLSSVDELRLGAVILEAASEVVSRDWQLLPAVDPRFVNEEGGGDDGAGSDGADSPLVGSPAPDFKLALLDGAEFQLSQQQGQVIVLDFWATWCGPCVHAMPIVDRVAKEFADQNVRLIAVNMQEDRESIEALLERLDLQPDVALDIDGATAEKYGVTAIPQTVIVDRQGNVARLFIGGGGAFEDQLRTALEQVVAGAAE